MSTRPISRQELKLAIRDRLVNDPNEFFAILREVRDHMEASGQLDRSTDDEADEPSDGDRVRAEIETDLAMLADFFRGFA